MKFNARISHKLYEKTSSSFFGSAAPLWIPNKKTHIIPGFCATGGRKLAGIQLSPAPHWNPQFYAFLILAFMDSMSGFCITIKRISVKVSMEEQ